MSAADETASCCLLLHFKQRDRLRHIADWTQLVHASRKPRALPFGVFDIVYVALSRSSDRAFAFQVSIAIFSSFLHAGHPSGVGFFLFGGDGNCEREEVLKILKPLAVLPPSISAWMAWAVLMRRAPRGLTIAPIRF
jgi:hypothetical protein